MQGLRTLERYYRYDSGVVRYNPELHDKRMVPVSYTHLREFMAAFFLAYQNENLEAMQKEIKELNIDAQAV